MKWIKNNKTEFIFCGVIILIYCLNKCVLIKNSRGISGYFLRCYLDDLMAPIFILALSSMILRWAGYELQNFWIILLIGVFAGVVWEYVIPFIKKSSVTDPYDLLCYIIGTIVYYGIKRF